VKAGDDEAEDRVVSDFSATGVTKETEFLKPMAETRDDFSLKRQQNK